MTLCKTTRFLIIVDLVLLCSTFLASGLKIASKQFYTGITSFADGGEANIISDTSINLAAKAETQALRQYATHKDLRIICTVAEVAYCLVANKKGISSLTNLKGKKSGTIPSKSAAYFVGKLLASAELKSFDYSIVSGGVCSAALCSAGKLPYILQHGSVDAIGMWEPAVQLAIDAIGECRIPK